MKLTPKQVRSLQRIASGDETGWHTDRKEWPAIDRLYTCGLILGQGSKSAPALTDAGRKWLRENPL